MAGPRQKSRRLETLIKIRSLQFDQEFSLLNQIKTRSKTAVELLQQAQTTYIEGVEKLNRERQSPERKMLDALERGVDFAKDQWYQRLLNLRLVEEEERRQLAQVTEAQKRLRMLEKLDERYVDQHIEQLRSLEQKQLDEFALQISRRKIFN